MAESFRQIARDALPAFIDRWIARREVFAPVMRNNICRFEKLGHSVHTQINEWLTKVPIKELFLPKSECLYSYLREADGTLAVHQAEVPQRERIIFGVRPCDGRALMLLDQVFLSGENIDLNYCIRREKSVIVGIACKEPRSTCFCTGVGGGPFSESGLDALLLERVDGFLVKIITPKGETAFHDLPEASAQAAAFFAEARSRAEADMPLPLPIDEISEKLEACFNHPLWGKIHEPCIGCGVCAFFCPTCHCFDLTHEPGAAEGSGRCIRSWDTCMFPLFTKQASGENPRPSGRERMRQRMMHKFSYFVRNHGMAGCVGCGRCIAECPVAGDIRDVLEIIERLPVYSTEGGH